MPKNICTIDIKNLKKIDRALIIRDAVLVHDGVHGRWETLDLPDGGEARVRAIDAGLGWSVIITSPFSGIPYDLAMRGGSAGNAVNDQVVMDMYLSAGPKVLSIATSVSGDVLISMIPGPWEKEMFGLERITSKSKV